MQKNLITADDWGLSQPINRGILQLAKSNAIGRVSLMARGGHLDFLLDDLKALRDISLGLHFDLTSHGSVSIRELFCDWVRSRKSRNLLLDQFRKELTFQINELKRRDIRIHHFDGHEHVHLLPGLVENLADILISERIDEVRLPLDWKLLMQPKRAPIALLSLGLRNYLRTSRFKSHPFFYPSDELFLDARRVEKVFNEYQNCEILVHPANYQPGDLDDFHSDPLKQVRQLQFNSLMVLADSKFQGATPISEHSAC